MFPTKLRSTRWFLTFIEKCDSKSQNWKSKDSQYQMAQRESSYWRTCWIPTPTLKESNCPPDPGGRDWLNHRLLVHGYEGPSPWGDGRVCEGAKSWPQGKPSQGFGHSWALGSQPCDGKSWSPSQGTRAPTSLCSMPVLGWPSNRIGNYYIFPQMWCHG